MSTKTHDDVLRVATKLFAQHGYDGVSTRQICEQAGASANAIHYHFGSKEALYHAILDHFADKHLAQTARMLADGPENLTELSVRLRLFVEDSIIFYLDNADELRLVQRELEFDWSCVPEAITSTFVEQQKTLSQFFEYARDRDLIRQNVDPAIVAGTLIERMTNQVRYAPIIEQTWDISISSSEYRKHWIKQTVDLLLFGVYRGGDSSEDQ